MPGFHTEQCFVPTDQSYLLDDSYSGSRAEVICLPTLADLKSMNRHEQLEWFQFLGAKGYLNRGDSQRTPDYWSLLSEVILWRDGRECRCPDCPKSFRRGNNGSPVIHHIQLKEWHGSDDPRNLVTLCGDCHKLIHDYGELKAGYGADLSEEAEHCRYAFALLMNRRRSELMAGIEQNSSSSDRYEVSNDGNRNYPDHSRSREPVAYCSWCGAPKYSIDSNARSVVCAPHCAERFILGERLLVSQLNRLVDAPKRKDCIFCGKRGGWSCGRCCGVSEVVKPQVERILEIKNRRWSRKKEKNIADFISKIAVELLEHGIIREYVDWYIDRIR